MSQSQHWNYYMAIEEDVQRLSRYVDFNPSNYATHSIEIARLLMTSCQDLDVILKQLSSHHGHPASNEQGYRKYLPTIYPKMVGVTVDILPFDLSFTPFSAWASKKTPDWWTANNKVKHERHSHFAMASIENMLNALAALFIGNIYFHNAFGLLDTIDQGSRTCYCGDFIGSLKATPFGLVPDYKVT
jgi:hypothetical protein